MRFVRFSLLLSAFSVAGCGSGPKVTLCDFTTSEGEPRLICVDHDNKVFRISISEAELKRYIAMPSEDLRTLVEYCGLKGSDKAAVLARGKEIESILSREKLAE